MTTTKTATEPRPVADSARETIVVLNRNSKRTAGAAGRIHALLQARGVSVTAFNVVENSRAVRAHVKRAAKAGIPAIVVGGGDGTLAHAVDALACRGAVLGVLPLGTGNSFARSLGLDPNDLDAAVETIARGNDTRIDLGRVNGTYFANFATIGLSSQIADRSSTMLKRWTGALAYALAAWRPFLGHDAFRARIRWRSGRLELRTQDIVIANGRYFGASPMAPGASLVDGRLTLYATDDPSRAGALVTYLAFGVHAQAALPDAHVISAPRFEIRTRPKQWISIDGSLLEKTPARLRVVREALRVFVPDRPLPGA